MRPGGCRGWAQGEDDRDAHQNYSGGHRFPQAEPPDQLYKFTTITNSMPLLQDSNNGTEGQADALPLCKRCNVDQITHKIRSESVCKKCFSLYVTTKGVKRMEAFRMRGSTSTPPRKLLLPLSFGPSSASLLHILDQQLELQYGRMNRGAYELFVVHVDLFLEASDRQESFTMFERYKARFLRHTYISVGLEEALLLDNIDWKSFDLPESEAVSQQSGIERLQEIVGSVGSSTSRADVVSTLLTRLLVDLGKKYDCESIVFGDSTTKIAERTIAQTAKGRGFSIPWQVSDGQSPYGIGFNYPLRDLLKKELVTFTHDTPLLEELVVYPKSLSSLSASSKTTTIDDLMAQYFESVEENYPSIVANVVRTSSKLQPSTIQATHCSFCDLPVVDGTDGIHGWAGDQNSVSRAEGQSSSGILLCYGCSRSIYG